jgi:hypothetical protein
LLAAAVAAIIVLEEVPCVARDGYGNLEPTSIKSGIRVAPRCACLRVEEA